MRFSAVFEPRQPMRLAQVDERAPVGMQVSTTPQDQAALPSQGLPEDLDQRVRQSGEWQLEDW